MGGITLISVKLLKLGVKMKYVCKHSLKAFDSNQRDWVGEEHSLKAFDSNKRDWVGEGVVGG